MSRRPTTPDQKTIPRRLPGKRARQAIARVAYELYLRRGKEPGHDLKDWFAAERLLQEKAKRRKQQARTRESRLLPERRETTR